MIRCIIFDMDGVLIDTEVQSSLGWLWAAQQKGISMPVGLIDRFKGAPAEVSGKMFSEYYDGKYDYWEMRKLRVEHIYKIRETESVPAKKGVTELLEYIREQGLLCAVATSTKKESAEKSLHRIGAWEYLSAVVYGDQVEHGKPAPDIFLMAAEKTGCRPQECVVIEDSVNGILAGHAAGMHVIHVPDTVKVPEDVRNRTEAVCENLLYVREVLEKWEKEGIQKLPDYGDTEPDFLFVDRVHVRNTFDAYTKKYNMEDPKIRLKALHTLRVASFCERIAKSIPLSAYDTEILWLCGMLHDIGRFEQVRRYGTFSDAASLDHAEFGADLLFKEGLLKEFLPEKGAAMEKDTAQKTGSVTGSSRRKKTELELLELALRVHSRYEIPEGLTEREKTFCNVLRDADKIDILRANVETGVENIYDITTEALQKEEVTAEVYEAFRNYKTVTRGLKKTAVDHIVGHAALIFGLVYEESKKMINEQGYIWKLLDFQSENPNTRKIFEEMRTRMKKFLGSER